MYEWRNDSEALGYSKSFEIHPSSIVFSSGKSRMRSMNKGEADELMQGQGNWSQHRKDDGLPLFVYGPNIINPETNKSRYSRNRCDAVSILTRMEGVNKLINSKHQISCCDIITKLRAEIELQKVKAEGTVAVEGAVDSGQQDPAFDDKYEGAIQFSNLSEELKNVMRNHPIFCEAAGVTMTIHADDELAEGRKRERPPEATVKQSETTAIADKRVKLSETK